MTKNTFTQYRIYYYAGANGQPKITLTNSADTVAGSPPPPTITAPNIIPNAGRLVFYAANAAIPANSVTSQGEIILNFPAARFLDVLNVLKDKTAGEEGKPSPFERVVVLEDNGQGYLYTENLAYY